MPLQSAVAINRRIHFSQPLTVPRFQFLHG
jgi:hypothetical protein